MEHLSEHDLERYHLGMVTDKREKERIEDHIMFLPSLRFRAEERAEYMDVIRAAIIVGDFDLLDQL